MQDSGNAAYANEYDPDTSLSWYYSYANPSMEVDGLARCLQRMPQWHLYMYDTHR
jgi:hypothetical protein